MKKLAVFVSGSGTILEAMIAAELPIALVLADRQCRGIDLAIQAEIPYVIVDRRHYGYRKGVGDDWNRRGFTEEIIKTLRQYKIDLVAMAGFMTILHPTMFRDWTYYHRVLNTHPALLPAFRGECAVEDALAAGVKITGCTIHWATDELDAGPIVAQEAVRVLSDDTVETLHERIKTEERKLYVSVLRELISS